ncbi:hypothetical protein DNTS_013729 [Danionella cerebrum]|uniref:DNA excision repair protein ERCC-1 n=1 Tax=Danionella cerebrum TaxID=2873325 RepID=A0A553R4Y1_9TELE|nr:hypothetical protein DNTS_013729 [Danionella translucida]
MAVVSLFKSKYDQGETSSVPAPNQPPLSYAEFVVQNKIKGLQGAHGLVNQRPDAQSVIETVVQSKTGSESSPEPAKSETEQQGPAEDQTRETVKGSESCVIPPHLIGTGNSIVRGNPILKFVRNVPWEFGEVVPDYVLGRTTCALFLSVRYHNLNPNYIHERLKQLGQSFTLRVLLVQKDAHHALKELARISIMADCTLILSWSPEEAGRYLETYKSYEKKPADLLKEQVEKNYLSQVTDCLTTVKSVNKTDAMTLLSTFSTLEGIIKASKEELVLCPGLGPQKAKRLYDVLHQPFIKNKKKDSGMESGIFGGKEAKPHSRPYMASIQINKHHTCGGMLIRQDYVLTAAHCLNRTKYSGRGHFEVVLGAHNISKKETSQQRIAVKKYIQHHLFERNKDFSYDIMLLKLNGKAKLNKFVQVMPLPKKSGKIPANVKCTISGWGYRSQENKLPSDVLQEVALKLQFSFECKAIWQQYFNSETMICSVPDGKHGFCKGDSGSPLICNTKPQALASYTSPESCVDKKYPQVLVQIAYFLPWIKKKMD